MEKQKIQKTKVWPYVMMYVILFILPIVVITINVLTDDREYGPKYTFYSSDETRILIDTVKVYSKDMIGIYIEINYEYVILDTFAWIDSFPTLEGRTPLEEILYNYECLIIGNFEMQFIDSCKKYRAIDMWPLAPMPIVPTLKNNKSIITLNYKQLTKFDSAFHKIMYNVEEAVYEHKRKKEEVEKIRKLLEELQSTKTDL